jgi:hypothetical protein
MARERGEEEICRKRRRRQTRRRREMRKERGKEGAEGREKTRPKTVCALFPCADLENFSG